ncbi:MAG: nucleotidyltransferase domain-containing protein, partial [Candidatus Diapherotrites archaeon]
LERRHYLRELADEENLAPSQVHKIMAKLASRKIVLAEMQKNRKFFSLNYSSPLTRRILSLMFINKITGSTAFKKFSKLKPKGIYLFGTAASGEITADSDIDMAVYFETKPNTLMLSEIKRELSNELKKEIQLIVLTGEKIDSMEKENTELLRQIKNKSMVLEGAAIE